MKLSECLEKVGEKTPVMVVTPDEIIVEYTKWSEKFSKRTLASEVVQIDAEQFPSGLGLTFTVDL